MCQSLHLPTACRVALLVVLTGALAGCSLGYYLQAASGHLEIMRRAEPIDRLLADPETDPALARRLEQVQSIRAYAIDTLGLPDNASYTRYADLGRPAAVYNVVAVPEFALEPRRWCFPIAGCLPYRGYFDRDRAERKALGLRARGYDTQVGGVTAYSTLGRFRDPVLSTMLDRGLAGTAAVIFHELAHQQLYIGDDAEFNEAYATAIEQYGTRRWLAAQGRDDELLAYERRLEREGDLTALIRGQRDRLGAIYARDIDEATMRAQKAMAFARMRAEYVDRRADWEGPPHFDGWLERPLNNAHLLAVATYRDLVPGFEALLATSDDIVGFHAAAERLAGLPREQRHERLLALAARLDVSGADRPAVAVRPADWRRGAARGIPAR